MDSVFARINKKCEIAKKRLIIIPPAKKRRCGVEPYLREVTQGMVKRRMP